MCNTKTIKKLLHKYKQILLYLFFGACTVVINTAAYDLLFYCLGISNILSNIVAWIVAVLFAFVTNKLLVFNSKGKSVAHNLKEAVSFFLCRAGTGVIDISIMYFAVDILIQNAFVWKIISNIIVIIVNYIASKLLIFAKPLDE